MQNYGKFRKIKILKPIKSAYSAHVKSVYTDRGVTTYLKYYKFFCETHPQHTHQCLCDNCIYNL